MGGKPKIAIVAMVRNERPFMDEWLLYHRLIGTDHFFIYDDDLTPGLEEFLSPHKEYTTVIRWHGVHQDFTSLHGDKQTKAYTHATGHFLAGYQWAAFIDIDEFIVLDRHNKLDEFMASLGDAPEISLRRQLFGHNGHYENPQALVTSELTRRRLNPEPDCNGKSIIRCDTIAGFRSVHHCELKHKHQSKRRHKHRHQHEQKQWTERQPKSSDTAHINHYICRSFTRWMDRPDRGYACDVIKPTAWEFNKEGCLRMFVEAVAVDCNEHVDEQMLRFKPELEQAIETINEARKKEP